MYFKGSAESKEQKYLEAFCEHYRIDIEKKFSELSDDEIHQLLYADDQIKYKSRNTMMSIPYSQHHYNLVR